MRNVGALQALHDGELTRDHVDDAARDHKGRNAAGTAAHHRVVVGADGGKTADARTDRNARHRSVFLSDLEAGVLKRHQAGGNAEMHEAVEAADFLDAEVLRGVEILHFACDLAAEFRRIKGGDAADAALAFKRILPACRKIRAKGGDHAEAGHDYAAIHHFQKLLASRPEHPEAPTDGLAETRDIPVPANKAGPVAESR